MNAAIAIHGHYAYIGSRTDGTDPARHAGVMIVDISRPSHPRIVREMQPPLEGNIGESSRELRFWHSQDILIVLHTNCAVQERTSAPRRRSTTSASTTSRANATNPRLLPQLNMSTHEFFLWEDPRNPIAR